MVPKFVHTSATVLTVYYSSEVGLDDVFDIFVLFFVVILKLHH